MPIRINLLAEQQAAEEARRRDPVKRVIWVGSGLTVAMLLWSASLQLRMASARSELARVETKLQSVEDNSKEARQEWANTTQVETRLANLQRYSTNRFFCANVLDALQQVVLDDIRVIRIQTSHTFSTNAETSFRTNIVIPLPPKSGWALWKKRDPGLNVQGVVNSQLAAITNKLDIGKGGVPLKIKTDILTNDVQATANVEIIRPTTATEQVVLTIKARDYGLARGRRIDEFSKAIAAHPYFAQRLYQGEGKGISLRERAIQAEIDPADTVMPGKPFVPFVLECRYRETIRANE
jgi:hypothetical protein